MKSFVLLLLLSASSYIANAQTTTHTNSQARADTFQIVEAACGQCKFGIKGDGCNLAVRINDQPYFVDGSKIDDHGDAHADDGFCNKIRKATVSGSVVNNRFLATSFKLLPEEKPKQ